jgi:hypothetical protein
MSSPAEQNIVHIFYEQTTDTDASFRDGTWCKNIYVILEEERAIVGSYLSGPMTKWRRAPLLNY